MGVSRALRPLRSIRLDIRDRASGTLQLSGPAAAARCDRRHARRPHLRPRARPEHQCGRAFARPRARLTTVGRDREPLRRPPDRPRRRPHAHAAVVAGGGDRGPPGAEAVRALRAGGQGRPAHGVRGAVSVRSEPSDVPEHLRRRRADAGDPRSRAYRVRILRGYAAGRARRRAEIPSGRNPSHSDRPGSPALPRRTAAARRIDPPARRDRHLVHRRAQHHALARGAQPRQPAGAHHRAGHRAEHRVCRRRQPADSRRARRPRVDRVRVRLHPRLRVRHRPARDGPAGAGARLVALLFQRRGRDRSTARRGRGGHGAGGAAFTQRDGGAAAGLRRIGRRHGRGHILVHPTGLFSWRHLMRRGIVLGGLLALGALAAVKAQPPAANAPKVIEVEKVKDNLFVLRGGGGNTAVFVTASGVVVVDAKNPGWGQPILDKVKELTPKPITTLINTHTHGDHVSGNVEFPATVEVITQENTKTNMEKMDIFKQNNSKGMPKRTFKDKLTVGKGADQIDLYYFGPGHTNGDAWVVFPALRVVHAGDLFANKGLPLVDGANGGSVLQYPDTV